MIKYVKNNLNCIKDLQYLDIKTFLTDHILTKVDRASMANSIEVRVPFLDHRLIEFVMKINENIIYKNKTKKYLLKKLAQNILPILLLKKQKKGFSAPLGKLGFIKKYLDILENSESVKD
ncbi:MAG: asparagine synthase-related protein, partial [Candidatus Lokiarchaeota archaeon]